MSQSKVVHSLFLLLFLGVVTSGIFFLLNLQLTPLFHEIGRTISTTNGVMAEVAQLRPTPTPTMPNLTLDMVPTLTPTLVPSPTTVAPTGQVPTAPLGQMGTVNSDLVNLRSYPSLAGEIVGQAKQGEQFEILAVSNDGLWVQVCCPLGSSEATRQSWVSMEFMVLEPAWAQSAVATSATSTQSEANAPMVVAAQSKIVPGLSGTVNSPFVNLRYGPDTTYPTVGQVSEQTKVTITGRNATGTWWQICCPPGAPQVSWISAEFIDLTVTKEEAMAQVATTIVQ